MIIKTVSTIKKIALTIFLTTILLASLFYFLLQEGITIEHLRLPLFQIGKLYLKLDKKLIVEGNDIYLPASQSKKTDIGTISKLLEYLPKFFQQITLRDIHFDNKKATIIYKKDIFLAKSDNFQTLFRLYPTKNVIRAKVEKFYFTPYNLRLNGDLVIQNNHLEFNGFYNFEGVEGSLQVRKEGTQLFCLANSKPFTNKNLRLIFRHFSLHNDIKKWSYEYIKAKEYKLLSFRLHHNLKKPFTPNSFEALAEAKGVVVKFHPKLSPAFVKKVHLHYSKDTLDFKLFEPHYKNKDLQGSYVKISDLSHFAKSRILIHLQTKSRLDNTIKQVLHAYNIDIPIEHKKGSIDAKLSILLFFKGNKLDIVGDFFARNALIYLEGVKFHFIDTLFKLHNDTLYLKNGNVKIAEILDTDTKGFIDFAKDQCKFFLHIKQAFLQKGYSTIIDAKNVKDVMLCDLQKKWIHLKNVNIDIKFDKDKEIIIYDLPALKKYSPLLHQLSPKQGKANIFIKKDGIDFESFFLKPNRFFSENGKYIENFYVRGTIKKNVHISLNNFLDAVIDKEIAIAIKNVDINLTSGKKSDTLNKKIKLSLLHTTLYIKNRPLKIDSAQATIYNHNIIFNGKYKEGEISFKQKGNSFSLLATRLSDDFVNTFLQKQFFSGGTFSLIAHGDRDNFRGKVTLSQTHIKNLKALNNIFAFLNTVPALVTFNDPGFSTQGLFVKNGYIDFAYVNGKIFVKKLFLVSNSLTFDGYGIVDLPKDTITMQIKLITLKSVTNILNKIPVAGYLLFGKDGSIATTLSLSGSLKDPLVNTQLTKDTLQAPLNIIKRTLQMPFKIFQ
ncbi:Protein of unknown function [Nitratiruptor tergarcus DSM 16512]|uniref:YhdP central domain-containing protein n=1 Tax=Nitratiruptor tergarcus DSM 16512 TaxID=1069081 RepID=A0A1W1WTU2_9BACT|nr:Protein of unknown function [Nitratiruptor tergarcus DSM 16512]